MLHLGLDVFSDGLLHQISISKGAELSDEAHTVVEGCEGLHKVVRDQVMKQCRGSQPGVSLRNPIIFSFRTALKDSLQGPPTANCQLPPTANR